VSVKVDIHQRESVPLCIAYRAAGPVAAAATGRPSERVDLLVSGNSNIVVNNTMLGRFTSRSYSHVPVSINVG
jgi:hypothetical protein